MLSPVLVSFVDGPDDTALHLLKQLSSVQRPDNVLHKLKLLAYGRLKFLVGIQNDAEDFLRSLTRAIDEDCERHRAGTPLTSLHAEKSSGTSAPGARQS